MEKKSFSWKLKDVLLIAIAGVLFSFLYLGTVYVGSAISAALTPKGLGVLGWEPLYGIYFMASTFAILIIQEPGVGIVAEVIASVLEVLMGNSFGPSVILNGIIQGLGVEVAFAIFRYKRFDWTPTIISAFTVTAASYIYDCIAYQYYLNPVWMILVQILIRLVSAIIFTSVITKLLCNGLAKAGVLNAYPIGQQAGSKKDYEVKDEE